MDDDEVEI